MSETVINDNIHGHIRVSSELMRIIDTPQVQRLRDLKQLGLGSYVYPGATHTRFAHSIGVCHLAGVLLRELQSRQRELNITDRDIFCVQVAGLCHDLGHGPFSHMFEKALRLAYKGKKWKHEWASLQLFEKMVKENNLEDLFEDGEIHFIQELICPESFQGENRKGRGNGETGKEFLYEVVSNERTGIDVDKFDYFARDCHALGFSYMFNHQRYMTMIQVLECDGKKHICLKDRELDNVIIMFQTRITLHLYAYKHPVVCAMDKMVCEIFEAANNFVKMEGDDGKMYSLLKCPENMGAYSRLNDSVLLTIRDYKLSEEEAKDESKVFWSKRAMDLIMRMTTRRLFKFVFDSKWVTSMEKRDGDSIEQEIWEMGKGTFKREDIYVQIAEFGFGMKDRNPLKNLYIFSKQNPETAIPFESHKVSQLLLPKIFSESVVRVYCKSENTKTIDAMYKAAQEWEKQFNKEDNN